MKDLPISQFIKAHIKKESRMAMESMSGKMERFIKGNGLMGLRMDLVFGGVPKATHILENGETEKLTVTGFTPGSMAIDMKVNSNNALSMVKDYKNLLMETLTKVHTRMENLTGMGNIFGAMAVIIRESSKMDLEVEKDFGKNQINPTQILTKANF